MPYEDDRWRELRGAEGAPGRLAQSAEERFGAVLRAIGSLLVTLGGDGTPAGGGYPPQSARPPLPTTPPRAASAPRPPGPPRRAVPGAAPATPAGASEIDLVLQDARDRAHRIIDESVAQAQALLGRGDGSLDAVERSLVTLTADVREIRQRLERIEALLRGGEPAMPAAPTAPVAPAPSPAAPAPAAARPAPEAPAPAPRPPESPSPERQFPEPQPREARQPAAPPFRAAPAPEPAPPAPPAPRPLSVVPPSPARTVPPTPPPSGSSAPPPARDPLREVSREATGQGAPPSAIPPRTPEPQSAPPRPPASPPEPAAPAAPAASSEPPTDGGDRFSPDAGSVTLRVAPVSGFQGLMRVQDALAHLSAVREATVEAYSQGEARLRLHLREPVTTVEIAAGLASRLGQRTHVEGSSAEERTLRVALG